MKRGYRGWRTRFEHMPTEQVAQIMARDARRNARLRNGLPFPEHKSVKVKDIIERMNETSNQIRKTLEEDAATLDRLESMEKPKSTFRILLSSLDPIRGCEEQYPIWANTPHGRDWIRRTRRMAFMGYLFLSLVAGLLASVAYTSWNLSN